MNNGFVVVAHAVDHIKPKEQGGTDSHANLQSICKACHKAKTQTESIHGSKKW
jgi:5-methylcytosine-specific restriction protein A